MKPIYIYGLVDPRDNKTFYVGRTTDTQKRLVAHLREGRYWIENQNKSVPVRHPISNKAKAILISELISVNLTPTLEVLDILNVHAEVSSFVLNRIESMWASEMIRRGNSVVSYHTPASDNSFAELERVKQRYGL